MARPAKGPHSAHHMRQCREDMAACRLLAVYGTLRRCDPVALKVLRPAAVRFVGPGSLKGQLVHLGAYPGFILPADESGTPPLVQVDVLALQDPQLLYELDLYEEYNPFDVAASPYRRVRLPLTGSGDRPWVYVYQGPIARAKRIESGDWCRERGSLSARRRLPKAPRG